MRLGASRAEVVIVGGGIIGVAVAFYLAKAKYGKIILLEKEPVLGSGATSKAAGGIRAQFSSRVNVEMSMLSERIFGNFKDETGYDALFDKVGYIFVLKEDAHIESFKQAYELQKSLGLNINLLKPDEIAKVAPHVRVDDIQLATFCPDDGLGDPHEFLTGYDKACRKMGVEIQSGVAVTAIKTDGGKITAVETTNGTIACEQVINCAGPQAKLIAKMVNSDLKVEPVKRQIVTTGELSFVRPEFPMVVDVASGLYCHKESKGMLLGWADKTVKAGFDISIDPDYTDAILEKALNRIPQLEEAEIANQWAGLYSTTPDHRAIIGHDPAVKGMFLVVGFSGHGFMHAPAAGIITADLLTDKEPTIDITELSPERFTHGKVIEETNVI